MTAPPLLEAHGLAKSYGSVRALQKADLSLYPGEVLGLVGTNGAGKSTLLRLLSGLAPPSAGTMQLRGKPYAPRRASEALAAGVSLCAQEQTLALALNVEANITLGAAPSRFGVVKARHARQEVADVLQALGSDVSPDAEIADISPAERKVVQIARAIRRKAEVLILDEPTAWLDDESRADLMGIVRRLKARNISIVFVSHFLDEVCEISDRVTVLRDGVTVGTVEDVEKVPATIASMMVNGAVSDVYPTRKPNLGPVRLTVDRLQDARFGPLHFSVRAGEIVGLTGMAGSGLTELCEALAHVGSIRDGQIRVDDAPVRDRRDARAARIELLPDQRAEKSLLAGYSAIDNMLLSAHAETSRAGVINQRSQTARFNRVVDALSIRSAGAVSDVMALSGGNQQKICVGRISARDGAPSVLILNEPTQGVDVVSRVEIYRWIASLAEAGASVLIATTDSAEACGLADRVLVLSEGQITAELPGGLDSVPAAVRAAARHASPKEVLSNVH